MVMLSRWTTPQPRLRSDRYAKSTCVLANTSLLDGASNRAKMVYHANLATAAVFRVTYDLKRTSSGWSRYPKLAGNDMAVSGHVLLKVPLAYEKVPLASPGAWAASDLERTLRRGGDWDIQYVSAISRRIHQRVTQIEVMPKVIRPGSAITIRVSGYDGPTGLRAIQADCVFVEPARDRFSFSIQIQVEVSHEFTVTLAVPDGVPVGPHFVARLTLAPQAPNDSKVAPVAQWNLLDGTTDVHLLAFLVGDEDVGMAQTPAELVHELHTQRERRIRTRIEVGDPPRAITAQVIYLFSGLLVHAPQHCEGYSILPYGEGLPPTSIQMALNAFAGFAFNVALQIAPQQAAEFSGQRPLAAVVFHTIGAQSVEAAMRGVRPLVDDIALALAFDRGFAPEPFACIVANGADLMMWLLHRPYTGNVLAPFGATDIGAEVERLTGAMMRAPFAKLLLELYVQAVSDQDPMFQLFRFWSILELLAKRAIPDSRHHIVYPSGERIRLTNPGRELVTTSKVEAKVYKYLFDQGAFGLQASTLTPGGQFSVVVEGAEPQPPTSDPGLRLTLWEFIQAAYQVRNGVAHEGRFTLDAVADPASAKGLAWSLLSSPLPGLLLDHLKSTARIAVLRELHRLSEAGRVPVDD
jgi:hypothetical protein